jgi:hypothetical protein
MKRSRSVLREDPCARPDRDEIMNGLNQSAGFEIERLLEHIPAG